MYYVLVRFSIGFIFFAFDLALFYVIFVLFFSGCVSFSLDLNFFYTLKVLFLSVSCFYVDYSGGVCVTGSSRNQERIFFPGREIFRCFHQDGRIV